MMKMGRPMNQKETETRFFLSFASAESVVFGDVSCFFFDPQQQRARAPTKKGGGEIHGVVFDRRRFFGAVDASQNWGNFWYCNPFVSERMTEIHPQNWVKPSRPR